MNYSIKYYKGCRVLKDADEIIILYTEKTSELLKFAKKYSGKRIVVNCTSLLIDEIRESLEIFKLSKKLYNQFAVMLSFSQKDCIVDLYDYSIDYFFIEHINTLDKLQSFIKLGVSDVYITDELGFSLDKVSVICKENKVNVRVFPNIAQSSSPISGDTFKYFYIRPEDVDIYEPYVDYFEFYGELDRQSVLYKIYKEGQWLGTLSTLIGGLKNEIPNVCIVPYFGSARVKCDKRCLLNQNCNICQTILNLAEVLEKKDLGITTQRKKIDKTIEKEEKND